MKLIKISAFWCPNCLKLNKTVKKIKEENLIEIIEYDYDFDKDKIEKYDVKDKLPVLILENDGKIIKKMVGEKTYEEIKSFINI